MVGSESSIVRAREVRLRLFLDGIEVHWVSQLLRESFQVAKVASFRLTSSGMDATLSLLQIQNTKQERLSPRKKESLLFCEQGLWGFYVAIVALRVFFVALASDLGSCHLHLLGLVNLRFSWEHVRGHNLGKDLVGS